VKGHSEPAGHALQLPWPLSEKVPAAHAVATLEVHDEPAGQGMHTVAPADGAYRPVGHVIASAASTMGHMLPALHVVHDKLEPSWYEPAAQRVNVGDAAALQLYPGGHGWLHTRVDRGMSNGNRDSDLDSALALSNSPRHHARERVPPSGTCRASCRDRGALGAGRAHGARARRSGCKVPCASVTAWRDRGRCMAQ